MEKKGSGKFQKVRTGMVGCFVGNFQHAWANGDEVKARTLVCRGRSGLGNTCISGIGEGKVKRTRSGCGCNGMTGCCSKHLRRELVNRSGAMGLCEGCLVER